MKLRKVISVAAAGAAMAGILAGCSTTPQHNADSTDKIKVITTIFPEYDWAKNIAQGSDNVEVELLLNNGIDMHSYQPSIEDIAKISDCDMFIYVGGESDSWAEDALKNSNNKNMKVIKLMDVLGDKAREEETVEGMQADDDHNHTGEELDRDHDTEKVYDEHVWLSVRNAQEFVGVIAENLSSLDSQNKDKYMANAKTYEEELGSLDKEYTILTETTGVKTLLFADRFPFRYMTEDYNLNYYAAFDGCSAETEASFDTITFLAGKVDELNLKSVIKIDGGDGKLAQTVVDNTKNKNQSILTLDSMQSVTDEKISNGTTYISIMKDNLEVLKQALKG